MVIYILVIFIDQEKLGDYYRMCKQMIIEKKYRKYILPSFLIFSAMCYQLVRPDLGKMWYDK